MLQKSSHQGITYIALSFLRLKVIVDFFILTKEIIIRMLYFCTVRMYNLFSNQDLIFT